MVHTFLRQSNYKVIARLCLTFEYSEDCRLTRILNDCKLWLTNEEDIKMPFALTLEEAKEKALYHMHHGYH